MKLEEYTGIFKGKEVFVVADGPSCPKVETDFPVIAVNMGYLNVAGAVFAIVSHDHNHSGVDIRQGKNLEIPVLYSEIKGKEFGPNDVPYRGLQSISNSGLYVGRGVPDSGVAALSLALATGAEKIHLVGFEYRRYTEEESKEYFGTAAKSHASILKGRKAPPRYKEILRGKVASFDVFPPARIVNHCIYSNLPQFERLSMPPKKRKEKKPPVES